MRCVTNVDVVRRVCIDDLDSLHCATDMLLCSENVLFEGRDEARLELEHVDALVTRGQRPARGHLTLEGEDGFAVPAGGGHMLERGGDHVMLMGLTESLEDGESFPLTLVFEEAGEVVVEVPVDLTRQPEHGDHGGMNH